MRRRAWVGLAAALVVAATSSAQAPPAGPPTASAKPEVQRPEGTAQTPPAETGRLRVKRAVLGIRNRAIHEFYDEETAAIGKPFPIGDTPYSAKVLRFVPDFDIDLKTRRVASKSNRLDNPAMQIATWEGGVAHDTSWAFLNFPPHFSKRALLAFQILRIEFENHAPVTTKDVPKIDSTSTGGKPR